MPWSLQGQVVHNSSIVGQVFSRVEPPDSFQTRFTFDIPINNADVFLVSEEDTLRTKTDSMGAFSFPSLNTTKVILTIVSPKNDNNGDVVYPISAAFDIMPGENYVLTPVELTKSTFLPSLKPIVTKEGSKWIYFPSESQVPGKEDFVVEMLKGHPSIEYNKRKNLYYIPEASVQFVNGAVIICLSMSEE